MHYEPKCISKVHQCKQLCVSKNCKIENPFICDACRHFHNPSCTLMVYKEFIKKMHIIQGLNKREIISFEDQIDRLFRDLMETLKREFVRFREDFEQFNIPEDTAFFYARLRKGQENLLTGEQMSALLQQGKAEMIEFKIKNEVYARAIKSEIYDLQEKVIQKLPSYYRIQDHLEQRSIDSVGEPNYLQQIDKKFVKDRREFVAKGLIKECEDIIQKLVGREIHNIQIAYRASEHEFSAKAFHKRCDGMENTLTIARTEFGNIVGAFCALPWKSPTRWEYYEDKTNNTFLFSLSKLLKNLRFDQQKRQFAIAMHGDYGPSFGDDFVIYDKANKTKSCWSNFPDVYACKTKQIPHSSKVIKEFVGVDDHFQKFNLFQWEVYKVSFSKNQEIQRSFIAEYDNI